MTVICSLLSVCLFGFVNDLAYGSSYNDNNYLVIENVPKVYKKFTRRSFSRGYRTPTSYERKRNNIKSNKAVNIKKFNLHTNLFLPVTLRKYWDHALFQSFVIHGKYLYVLYKHNVYSSSNQGWIVRYDIAKMKKLHLFMLSHLSDLRRVAFKDIFKFDKSKGYKVVDKKRVRDIKKAIKVGPKISNVGHGQTLSVNSATGELWILQDSILKGGYAQEEGKKVFFARINPNSLTIDQRIPYYQDDGFKVGHVMTFDDSGTVYMAKNMNIKYAGKNHKGVRIYYGVIIDEEISFMQYCDLLYRGGEDLQAMGYNEHDQKLYLVYNGLIMSVDTTKIHHENSESGGKNAVAENVDKNVVGVIRFATNREFEGISFDTAGHLYVGAISGPELLRSTKPLIRSVD